MTPDLMDQGAQRIETRIQKNAMATAAGGDAAPQRLHALWLEADAPRDEPVQRLVHLQVHRVERRHRVDAPEGEIGNEKTIRDNGGGAQGPHGL